MAVKHFEVSARELQDNDVLDFTLGDDKFRAKRPKNYAWMKFVADMNADDAREAFLAIARFLDLVLSDKESAQIGARLEDDGDPLDIDHVTDVVKWMVEEWTGRPTESSSD